MTRPRILFAWEIGENFGHVSKIAETVRALAGRAECWAALRNPVALRQIVPDVPVHLLPAPVAHPPAPATAEDHGHSYPDVLRHFGWSDPKVLSALVEAWRSLIDLVRPDVLAAQAAPTALLAARGLGIPTATIGSGFDSPPMVHPMPPFLHWQPGVDAPVQRETAVLESGNRVLEALKAPQMARFRDLLDVDARLLTTFAEMDQYAPRSRFEPGHPPYLGQLTTIDRGAEMSWRPDAQRRILAYLRPGGPAFDAGIRALARLDRHHDVILACPGAPKGLADRLVPTAVRLVDGAVRLDRLLPECDLGISHASIGVSAAFVMAGVPQVGLPNHTEQMMVAHALGQSGLSVGLAGRYGPEAVHETIEKALQSRKMADAARRARGQLRARFPEGPAPEVARSLLDLAG